MLNILPIDRIKLIKEEHMNEDHVEREESTEHRVISDDIYSLHSGREVRRRRRSASEVVSGT